MKVNSSERGAVIAEFAFAMPAMLVVVMGVIQVSLFFSARAVVEYAAFAAARADVVGEDPAQAAQFVCSSISGPSVVAGTGRDIVVPGWPNNGVLPRSRSASVKTLVTVQRNADNTAVTAEVTHIYEFVVPVVGLFLDWTPIPSDTIQQGDVPRGMLVMLNGAPHVVIKCRYTRPIPWNNELQNVDAHPTI